jgi:RNA polymerase sigma factor (sigma-70 family)
MITFGFRKDEKIIARILAGQHQAFGELVDRYLPMVRGIAYARVGNLDDADDVAQDSFVLAYQRLHQLRERAKFAGWLCAITRNVCVKQLEKRHKERAGRATLPREAVSPPDYAKAELIRAVRAEVEGLDVESREVLLLHYYSGKRSREIASLLDLSDGAVRKRLQRGREALGDRLLKQFQEVELRHADDGTARRRILGAVGATGSLWVAGAHAATPASGVVIAGPGWTAAAGFTSGKWLASAAIIATISVASVLIASNTSDTQLPAGNAIATPPITPSIASSTAEPPMPVAAVEVATPAPDPTVAPSGIPLRGRVLHADGTPVPAASVLGGYVDMNYGRAPHEKTVSDEFGAFTLFLDQPADEFLIWADKEGYTRFNQTPLKVPEEGLTGADYVIFREAIVEGRVVDTRGAGLANIPVAAVSLDTGDQFWAEYSYTDETGTFRLPKLLPGRHTLATLETLEPMRPESALQEIAVSEGEHKTGVRIVYDGDTLSASGRVTDAAGKPIHRVGIHIRPHGVDRYHSTKQDGSFLLTRLPEGPIHVTFRHDEYEILQTQLNAGESSADIVLTTRGGVSGRVIDAQTGQPVTTFVVGAAPGGVGRLGPETIGLFSGSVQTDPEGQFHVENVPLDEATIAAKADGYMAALLPVALASGEHLEGVTLALERGHAIEGAVVNSEGAAVSGAPVFLGDPPTKESGSPYQVPDYAELWLTHSDEQGKFRLAGMEPGILKASAIHPDFGAGTVTAEAGEGVRDFATITLSHGGSIRGVVRLGSEPLSNNMTFATPVGGNGMLSAVEYTDESGRFLLTGLESGEVSVVANFKSPPEGQFRRLVVPATVVAGQITEVTLTFGTEFGSIRGSVMRSGAAGGDGFVQVDTRVGADVEEIRGNLTDGAFYLERVPAGPVSLRVRLHLETQDSGDRQIVKSMEAEVKPGEELSVSVDFSGTARVTGQVLGLSATDHGAVRLLEGDVQVPDFSLETRAAMEGLTRGVVSVTAEGTYDLEGLEPGTYTLVANVSPKGDSDNKENTRIATMLIQLAEGATAVTDFDLR